MITPPTATERHVAPRARPPFRARWQAVFALAGLLLWTALSAPRIISLAPGLAQQSGSLTHLMSGIPALWSASTAPGATGGAPDYALGGAHLERPVACTAPEANAVGRPLTIPADAFICGPVMVTGGGLTVYGRVQGSAQSIGGSTVVYGEVDGDISAIGGDITVEPGARTSGALNAIGGSVRILPGAQVAGPVERDHVSPRQMFDPLAPHAATFWLALLFWICVAVGLTAFAPEAVGHVRYTIAQNFLLSGLVGAGVALFGVVVGAILFITCLGAIVTAAIAIALWLGWIVGTVAFASWLGESLLRGLRVNRAPPLLTSSVLGVILLTLLKAMPIAGFVVSLLVGCVGLGAAGLTLLSARRVSYKRLSW